MAVVRKQDHSSILLWSIYSCTAYYEKFPDSWIFQSLSQVTLNLDSKRKAINSTERARRIEKASNSHLYPYYGATGETGKIDDYLLDETTILVGKMVLHS